MTGQQQRRSSGTRWRRVLFKGKQASGQLLKFIALDAPKWLLFSLPSLEWVKLLAVPLVIAVATSIITGQIQQEANQNAVLKAYFDKLEELTFEQNLLGKEPNEGAIVLARGRTVAALRELDLPRRTQLIDFLQASDLSRIDERGTEPVISFKEQNLFNLDLRSINLSRIDFQKANLEGADLQGVFLLSSNLEQALMENVNLQEADMNNANLKWTLLKDANLRGAFLTNVNLQGAHLWKADMQKADLSGANLQEALLEEVDLRSTLNLTDEQLGKAMLCRTKLPEGSRLDPNHNCPS